MKSNYTRKETGRKIAEIIRDYYSGNMTDITVGLTKNGEVNYEFDITSRSVEVVFYSTNGGWGLGDGDYDKEKVWATGDVLDGIGDLLTGDWAPTNENNIPIPIEYVS